MDICKEAVRIATRAMEVQAEKEYQEGLKRAKEEEERAAVSVRVSSIAKTQSYLFRSFMP